VRDSLEAAVASFELPISVPTATPDRPDVRQAEARIGAADARIDQIRREARVDASVFGSYMRMTRGFPPAGVVTDGTVDSIRLMTTNIAVGAMVTVPIVNRNQGQLAAARAARIAAAAEYDATRLTAEAELAAAEASAAQATAAVALYRDRAGALARRNLSVVAQSYDLGRVTVFDVLLEQRRFFDVERAYTDALRAAYEAHTALVRAMGGVQ